MTSIVFSVLALFSLGVAVFIGFDAVDIARKGGSPGVSSIIETISFIVASLICVGIAVFARRAKQENES